MTRDEIKKIVVECENELTDEFKKLMIISFSLVNKC